MSRSTFSHLPFSNFADKKYGTHKPEMADKISPSQKELGWSVTLIGGVVRKSDLRFEKLNVRKVKRHSKIRKT